MKRTAVVVASLVFLSAFVVIIAILPEARAATFFVGGGGPGNYTAIQAAIDDAFPGDSVFVYNGTYNENVIIGKPLTLTGESRDITIVDSRALGSAVVVLSNGVSVTGFTLTGSWWGDPLLVLDTVTGCRIDGNNISSGAGDGIQLLYSTNNTISNNTISLNNYTAINLEQSDGNSISNNSVTSNDHWAVRLYRSNGNSISNNNISNNDYGIIIENSLGIVLTDNVMLNDGIDLWGDTLQEWNTHEIDASNTVNGKPVYYWKNLTGGTVPPGSGQVILANCTGVTVENQNLSGGDNGIEVGFSSNILIRNNTVNSNRRNGILLFHGDNSLVINNNASRNFNGIHVQNSAGNTLLNNTASFSDGLAISIYYSAANTVANSTLLQSNLTAIAILESSAITLEGNVITEGGITLLGFMLQHWNSHEIDTNNTVNGKPVHYWKDVDGGTIPQGAGQVLLANCRDVIVENQNVSGSSSGVQVGFSTNVTVNNVSSFQNSRRGISLRSSSNSNITNSSFSGNDYGIYLGQFSDYNTFSNNTVAGNRATGLRVLSDNNTFVENTFSANGDYGAVWVSGMTYDNKFYHNSFMDSLGNHVYSSSASNQWDNGYPSGGNYWSDYAGFDQNSGPNQDQPGSDDIGDGAYVIDADSQDNYPLMYPFGTSSSQAPSNLRSHLSGMDLENVTLMWNLSDDDGTGKGDVVEYSLYRNTTYHPLGYGYALIGNVTNGTNTYLESDIGEGDPETYFYRVCAVNAQGIPACAAVQAAKFTRPLAQGPHLLSVPLVQSNESIETVLQTVKYDKAWLYDSSSEEWRWFTTSKGYRRGLWNMNHTMGIWVNVTEDSNLTVAGVVPINTSIRLHSGWNLVGFPSFNAPYTVVDLRAEVGSMRVEGYDPTPPYHLRVLGDAVILQAGFGYWVRVDADITWTVEID